MFIFQFSNDKIYNYVLFEIVVNFVIQKLKNKHTLFIFHFKFFHNI